MVADCEASWSEMALTEGQQHFLQKELLTAFAEAAPNLPYILRDQGKDQRFLLKMRFFKRAYL